MLVTRGICCLDCLEGDQFADHILEMIYLFVFLIFFKFLYFLILILELNIHGNYLDCRD